MRFREETRMRLKNVGVLCGSRTRVAAAKARASWRYKERPKH